MRLRSIFLPASLATILVSSMTSVAAGNGAEKTSWIQWEVSVPSPERDVRKAIEKVIAESAPEIVAQSDGKNHLRVVDATDEIVPVDGGSRFGSVLELRLKANNRPEREFKLRVELVNKTGFLYESKEGPGERTENVQAKIVEWSGLKAVFGTDFGLPTAR